MFATDLDVQAIDKARRVVYPEGIANHVRPDRLQRFFIREDSHYNVKSELRDCLTFATHIDTEVSLCAKAKGVPVPRPCRNG
jgi:two-component system CheB/CheR fusion protein